jgi:hypothetical protein
MIMMLFAAFDSGRRKGWRGHASGIGVSFSHARWAPPANDSQELLKFVVLVIE